MNPNATRLLVVSFCLIGGAETLAQDNASLPRTEFDQPDMQGVWFYGTSTPFDRMEALGDKQSYTEAEANELMEALLAADKMKAEPLGAERGAPEAGGAIAQNADHNFSDSRINPVIIDGQYRTSQIISPANGRFPYREGGMDMFQKWQAEGHGGFDGPEIRPASERCVGPNGGPMAPMVSWFYNANLQIVQTEDYVMMLSEMNHDARIIPLTQTRAGNTQALWQGNSIGHWDGDVLVVETTGFRPEESWFAYRMSDQLQVTERFELVSEEEIRYSYTFTDPEIYTEAVTVEKNITRRAPGEELFEYACHEGNYSMASILAGARRQEADLLSASREQ